MDELISIIIPVYNLEACIGKCLDSVLNQTYRSIQVIVVDDGSKDHSNEICNSFANADERVLLITKENGGVSSARNEGLRHVAGEYITFIDGDDTVPADYIEVYVSQILLSDADAIIGGVTRKSGGQQDRKTPLRGLYDRKSFFTLLCQDGTEVYGYACGKLYRTSVIRDNGILFNTEMFSQEDLDFNLSVYAAAERINCVDYCGYSYDYAPSNRKPPATHILGNQVKLFRLTKAADGDCSKLIPRFQKLLYTSLYHSSSAEDIRKLKELNLEEELLKTVPEQRREVRSIIKWFRQGQYQKINNYFSLRQKLRGLMYKLKPSK